METPRQPDEHEPGDHPAVQDLYEIDELLDSEAKEINAEQAKVDSIIQRNPHLKDSRAVAYKLGKLEGSRSQNAAVFARRILQKEITSDFEGVNDDDLSA